ncbi:MAG: enoyl-CoA hydratase/isomerase family protein [Planctomycetota bacterium]
MTIHRQDRVQDGLTDTVVTLDHAPLNVLDLHHCQELVSTLNEVRADDRTRLLVLRGAGRCFSAGVDIQQHTQELMPTLLPAFHDIFHALLGLPAITIAAVHGHCMGGAAELILACDRVVVEEDARVSFPEILVGCYPPVAIPLLVHRAGHGRAVGAICSGEEIPVSTLDLWGLVDRVVPSGGLDEAIEEELRRYRGKSPAVLGMTAELLHEEGRRAWGDRIPHLEEHYLERLLPHPDVAEGIRAFLEKRKPRWQSLDQGIDIDGVEGMAQ